MIVVAWSLCFHWLHAHPAGTHWRTNSTQQENTDAGVKHLYVRISIIKANYKQQYCFIFSSDRFAIPVKSAVISNLTAWCDQNLSNRALNALTMLAFTTEFGNFILILFQIFTTCAEKKVFSLYSFFLFNNEFSCPLLNFFYLWNIALCKWAPKWICKFNMRTDHRFIK